MAKSTESTDPKISLFKLNNLKSIPFSEKAQVQKTREDIILSVKEVLHKIGGDTANHLSNILGILGDNTPLCRLFYYNEQVNIGLPKIYIDEAKKIRLYDAGSHPLPIDLSLEFAQYRTELIRQENNPQSDRIVVGEQIIKLSNSTYSCALSVSIGLDDSYINSLIELDSKGESLEGHLQQGKGVVPVNLVKYYPRPYKPSSSYEIGEQYQILEDLGTDPRYENAIRYRLQQMNGTQPIGESFETLANYWLQQHWKQFGSLACTVIDKVQKERGWSVKFAMSDLAQAS